MGLADKLILEESRVYLRLFPVVNSLEASGREIIILDLNKEEADESLPQRSCL